MPTQQRIQASPFLPSIPAIAADDLGRVVFPGTSRAGRGLLSIFDRDPRNPINDRQATGPSTYTREAHEMRVGGLYPPHLGAGRPSKLFH
jgi:hypothetical protein